MYKRIPKENHFSRPHIFTELTQKFEAVGTVFLQVSEKYVLFAKTYDVYDPPKFCVFDHTENCRLVDLAVELPRIFGGNSAEYATMITLRAPKKVLILMATTEKEKKAWINTQIFYAGTRDILDAATPFLRTEKEKEKEYYFFFFYPFFLFWTTRSE